MPRKEEENAVPAALSLSPFNKTVLEPDIDARNDDEFEGNIAETVDAEVDEEEAEREEAGRGERARGPGDIVPASRKSKTQK